MPPIEAYIDTPSGGRMYAEKHPANSPDADQIPVLYFHSFLSDCRTVDSILPALTNRTVIAFDFEGHGNSTKPQGKPNLDSLIAYIPLVLTHFGYELVNPIDVVAYSLGTCPALHLAVQTPRIVPIRRLVLMAPPDLSEPKELWEAAEQQVKSQRTEDLLLYCLSLLGSRARANPLLREQIQKRIHANLSGNRDCMAAMWNACSSMPTYWVTGGGYREETLAEETWVFWGREDGHSDRNACEMVARMTGAKIVPLDTGAFMSWENPEAVGQELKKILDC